MSRLGDLIRLERTRQKLTYKQVARKCGVSEKYLEEVESGRRIIQDDQARRILKTIGLKQHTEADFTLDDIAATVDLAQVQDARWEELSARNGSREWNLGQRIPATWSSTRRFAWGRVDLELVVTAGTVRQARVWTDSLDTGLSQALETALTGRWFQSGEMAEAIRTLLWPEAVREDLSSFISEMEN